jgi:hypothetical protein
MSGRFLGIALLLAACQHFVMAAGYRPVGSTRPVPEDGIRGVVSDSATGEPIAAVNIRILGTSRGTISNADGRYRLALEADHHRVVFSHLAYVAETLDVGPSEHPGPVDVILRPATLTYPEVLVLAEDPALEIIRKAIANKHAWMDRLKSYRFDAYTRQVVDRDTSVASITEAFTVGWVLSGDTLRERVVRKRQTANVPMEENFAAVRRLVNFNDDRISLFSIRINSERRSYTFVGPTAPDALDNYDYRLLRTRRAGGIEMYEIEMTPKTKLKPLFRGTITIADRSFAVVGVDLVPNETFNFPFLREIDLRYRQQFALYDSLFWMPADVRIDGGFDVGFVGLGIPRVGFRQVSSIYNYELNVPVPDSVLRQRTVTTDSLAGVYDSTTWESDKVVPLTVEESSAYRTLDSTETLAKQFRPGGVLGSLGGDGAGGAGSLLGVVDARYTRVEGLYIGGSKEYRLPGSNLTLGIGAGYGVSDKRGQVAGTVSLRPPPRAGGFGFGVSVFNQSERVPDGGYYGALVNSVTAVIDKNDAPDYYRALGWKAWGETSTGRYFIARVTFVSQRESPMGVEAGYSLFNGSRPFRPNPQAIPGNRRSIGVDLRFGREREDLDIVTTTNLEVSAEHSSPSILNSSFDYTRVSSTLTWSVPTFTTDLLFPPSLRLRIFAGKGFGTLPPQRGFSADSRSGFLGPFGTLRAGSVTEAVGDAVVAVTAEHNFRSLPFLLMNVPFFYENGIELVVHGATARGWTRGIPGPGGWYTEAGIGLNRILDLVRVDVTCRFREPRRLYVTVSVASYL